VRGKPKRRWEDALIGRLVGGAANEKCGKLMKKKKGRGRTRMQIEKKRGRAIVTLALQSFEAQGTSRKKITILASSAGERENLSLKSQVFAKQERICRGKRTIPRP